ncbi:MAG: ORF6N domain-containing protein [Candidatus Brocadia sp.]
MIQSEKDQQFYTGFTRDLQNRLNERNLGKVASRRNRSPFRPKALVQAVKRNNDRFSQDFMFQLTKEEADSLRFQIGMSKIGVP